MSIYDINQLTNWTFFQSPDPAVNNIQTYLTGYGYNGSVDVFDYDFANNTQPNVTDLCLTVLNRNVPYWSGLDDFDSNNLFNICVTYPNLTYDVSDSTVNGSFAKNLELFDIVPGRKAASKNITDLVTFYLNYTCEDVLCNQADGQGTVCNLETLAFTGSDNVTYLSNDAVEACQGSICSATISAYQSNADIGGVGVYISYIGQLFMALVIAIHVMYSYIQSYLRQRRYRRTYQPRSGVIFDGGPKDKDDPKWASDAFRESCVDFQKTQAWFVSSLTVAAFITTQVGQVGITDDILLITLSLNGMVLLSFTMISILYFMKGSWYVMVLTVLSYVLCAVFFWLALSGKVGFKVDTDASFDLCWNQFEDASHAKGISKYIIHATKNLNLYVASFAYTLFITVVSILWKAKPHYRHLKGMRRIVAVFENKWVERIGTVLIGLIYMPVFYYQVYLLVIFWGAVSASKSSWGFGQIVALAVWLPVLIDFAYARSREAYRTRHPEQKVREGNPTFYEQEQTEQKSEYRPGYSVIPVRDVLGRHDSAYQRELAQDTLGRGDIAYQREFAYSPPDPSQDSQRRFGSV